MNRVSHALLSLTVMAATCAVSVPAARAELIDDLDITKFNGTITDVGVVRGPGQTGGVEYRIRGKFLYSGPVDFTGSQLRIDQFFVDEGPSGTGGLGELMRQSQGLGGPETDPLLAPITLNATKSESDEAKYETPGRVRPQIVSKFKNKGEEIEFDIRLDRGMMRVRPIAAELPTGCPEDPDGRKRTPVTISFAVVAPDGSDALTVLFTRRWECPQPGRYHFRARD